MKKAEYFNLSEVKDYAKTLGFTKIARQAEGVSRSIFGELERGYDRSGQRIQLYRSLVSLER